MLTKKFTEFSADLLDTVAGILGEAKKCSDCGCAKCECEDDEDEDEMKESTAEYGKSIDAQKKKNITASDQNKISKLAAMMKAEKKPVKEESEQLDEYGLVIPRRDNLVSLKKHSFDNDFEDEMKKTRQTKKSVADAKKKYAKEEAEQIDELSKATMGRYINKAATKIGTQGITAGLKIASDENSKKNFKDMGKREKGIARAVNKLTKEEQEFIDSLNAMDLDEAGIWPGDYKVTSEKSQFGGHRPKVVHKEKGHTMYLGSHAYKKPEMAAKHAEAYLKAYATRGDRGAQNASAEFAKANKKHLYVKEDVEQVSEARGRPKKAGGKDFTIHPKTKEKLMHNNPEHMKKIELLQKHGVLQKPKTEAGQHIINQLQKAKTSMTGGSTIHFTHGDSKHVSGAHAAKLLDKYAGMKPNEKEDFQKKIGHSHEQLMKHV